MDRRFSYPDANPDISDLLLNGQFAMVGLAQLAEAVIGTSTVVDKFTLGPTPSPSLVCILGPGQIYQMAQLELTPISTLAADTHQVLKQGIALDAQNLTFLPPSVVGQAVNVLVQVAYKDVDGDPIIYNYYNAANPDVPLTGPSGGNASQPTTRRGKVDVILNYGIPATAGSQVTPAPSAGYVGLFVVTLTQGMGAITAGNIARYLGAPFITKLGSSGTGVLYGPDSGTANNLVITVPGTIGAYAAGQVFETKVNVTSTGAVVANVNGLGNLPVVYGDGSALSGSALLTGEFVLLLCTGTAFQVLKPKTSGSTSLFTATKGSDQSLSSSSLTDLTWTGSAPPWATWNGTALTVTAAGIVRFAANVAMYLVTTGGSYSEFAAYININGVDLPVGQRVLNGSAGSGTQYIFLEVAKDVAVSVGDVIKVRASINDPGYFSSAAARGVAQTFFTALKL